MISPEVVELIILGTAGTGFTAASGGAWWGVRRLIGKVDSIDVMIRGDGNGTVGVVRRLDSVHKEVVGARKEFKTHTEDVHAHCDPHSCPNR